MTISQLNFDIEMCESAAEDAAQDAAAELQLTATIRDTIRLAHCEISAINCEKIRINQSWRSSVTTLQNRHSLLSQSRQLIK